MTTRALVVLAVLAAATSACHGTSMAESPQFTVQDLDFFEKRVRPLLIQRCFECHSSKTEKLKGGLMLDSRDAIFRGGDSGPAAVSEDIERSLLLKALGYDDENVQMPPAGKLPEAEIAVLTEWVRRGLPFPASSATTTTRKQIDIAAGKKHWAFQPFVVPPSGGHLSQSPSNTTTSIPLAGPQTRIDEFVFAAQRQHNLAPSLEASRRLLIRRLKFDLLGLPPTIDEVRDFEADRSPDAYDRLVEHFLSSPHYGERWARLWLDVARYADVLEQWRTEPANAWLYRDWVVRAFNEDLPYDQFVRKQLAADLQPDFQPTDVAALGFLGLSPSYWKELKLDHNVIKQVVAEEWEERIEAISGTFLGLTLACARCHDHKFDPITQQDYYGLAGVLASIKLEERPIVSPDLAAIASAARTKHKELQDTLAKLQKENPAPTDLATQVEQLRSQIETLKITPYFDTPLAFAVSESSLHVLPDGPNRTKLEYQPNAAQNIPMQIRGNAANAGPVVPRRFLAVLSANEPTPFQTGSGRRELAEAIVTDAAPLAARVIVNRIWAAHFGRGLVTTPSNFGTQGDKPSHPELLDDLTARFIAHGWSPKWLHREIVLSATYRQVCRSAVSPPSFSERPAEAGTTNGAPAEAGTTNTDPENIWLARMPLRKLDVESWRDAMLAATGELDATAGGSPLELNDVSNRRRTVYGSIKRRELADILRLHDFPDPITHSAARIPTTTPLQQLFVLNSSFLQTRSAALAQRIFSQQPQDTAAQIRIAHEQLFQREPTADEVRLGMDYLTQSQADGIALNIAWRQYAQVLLASNEFQFVE